MKIIDVTSSMVAFAQSFLPVAVVSGGTYGVYEISSALLSDPHVAVETDTVRTYALELGSEELEYTVRFTINARSLRQREALRDLLLDNLINREIPAMTYSGTVGTPVGYLQRSENLIMRNYPNFDSERFFWVSVITVNLTGE